MGALVGALAVERLDDEKVFGLEGSIFIVADDVAR